MKKVLVSLLLALGVSLGAQANTGGIAWDKAPVKTNDLAALQNGAKVFVNYCLNCHSAAFMRYNRLKDIGLTEQQIKDNMLFTTDKVGETMKSAIDPKQAKEWFGGCPRTGHRYGLPLYLYAHLLCGRFQAHWLEQPGIPQHRYAPRLVATSG
jgi:ubiquinol-cytochrome c reductase cytochrome c1 subunit